MANYITISASDGSIIKRFRVISEGYDNGTPEKTMTMQKTVGGGMDISQGAVYHSWNPTIRVRGTEIDTSYGSLSELETFFGYNNPNTTVSDKLIFTDHMGVGRTVVMVGDLRKTLLGALTDGTESHYIVRARFQEVTGT
jgi:hypothetical protein